MERRDWMIINIEASLAHFFIYFGQGMVLASLMILGWLFLDRILFFRAACLVVTSIILNFALKSTFQIPLSPSLGKIGFAFPSGHMQSATVFYAWLTLNIPSFIFRTLMVIVLIGLGYSLYYFGYHHYFDILMGVLIAGLLVLSFYRLSRKNSRILSFFLFILSSSLMIYNFLNYGLIPLYVWGAYLILLGLLLTEKVVKSLDIKMPKRVSSKIRQVYF